MMVSIDSDKISNLRTDEPDVVQATPVPVLQRHGIYLAWAVLGLILVFGSLLLCAVRQSEFGTPTAEVSMLMNLLERATSVQEAAPSPEKMQRVADLMERISASRRASRDFWTSFAQFLLLNLLLPVLTALLGYVFGTLRKDDT
jgi:hypothetical protein